MTAVTMAMTPAFPNFGGGEWDPRSIPGLVSGFDSRFNITLSGTTITQWAARYGAAHIFTPAGTDPQIDTTSWVNSKGEVIQSILFDGVNDELICSDIVSGTTLPGKLLGGTDQPGTVIMVYQLLSTTGSRAIWAFTKVGTGSLSQQVMFIARYGSTDWSIFRQDDSLANATLSQTGVGQPNTSKHIASAAIAATTAHLDIDGVNVASGSFDVDLCTLDRVEIGARAGSNYANMRLVRLLFYSTQLSTDDLAAAYTGLRSIYL